MVFTELIASEADTHMHMCAHTHTHSHKYTHIPTIHTVSILRKQACVGQHTTGLKMLNISSTYHQLTLRITH